MPVVGSHIRSKPRAQYLFASAQAPPLILRTKLAQDRHGSSTKRVVPEPEAEPEAEPGGMVEEGVVEVATEEATEEAAEEGTEEALVEEVVEKTTEETLEPPHDAPLHLIICGRSDGEMGWGRRLGLPAGRDRRSTKWSAIIFGEGIVGYDRTGKRHVGRLEREQREI